jgi:hypothetical protein
LPRFARNDERDLFATAPTQPVTTGIETTIAHLINTFAHAKTFGSLIQIAPQHLPGIRNLLPLLNEALHAGDLYAQSAAKDLLPLVQQALMLGMQFDAVVANPPYMGSKYLTPTLKTYLTDNYQGFDKDLFSAFMSRDLALTKPSGQLGFMSPFVWMFISSYEELRTHFIEHATLTSLVQLEYSGFDGATVPICTFTFGKQHVADFVSSYVRLADFKGADQQATRTLEALQNKNCGWFYATKPDDFKKIPGSPVAYWISENLRDVFASNRSIGAVADTRKGMATGNNKRFVRSWSEISYESIGFGLNRGGVKTSGKKWFPYANGGDFRKWFGNIEDVVLWENDGYVLQTELHESGRIRAVNLNLDYIFTEGVTWTSITSSHFSSRYMPPGCLFSSAANSLFAKSGRTLPILGKLNSNVFGYLSKVVNPTLNMNPGDTGKIPFPKNSEIEHQVEEIVEKLIVVSKNDWDSREQSWDFSGLNWITIKTGSSRISEVWETFSGQVDADIQACKLLEVRNNSIFIEAYNLQDELSPEVPESQITLARANREKDSQRLISYAIGCVMGRYSLDEPGLIYAHAGNVGFDSSRYATFPADADGIVPITDTLWFIDDAAVRVREFLLAVWGADTLEENMAWLAESIGSKAGETPDESIRRYLSDRFYKDHLQTYKKRPIYWQFSSGKQGAFQALVYLHRYTEGTLARLRAEYVVPLTGKMQARLDSLEKDAQAASSTAARNKINKEIEKLKKKHLELLAYDEKLRHHADMRITLDLDDGVKVNYGKFGDLLADVKTVTGGAGDE